ncbi:MAG: glycosyltransferase family 2 protein [Chloroflexota bacterium]
MYSKINWPWVNNITKYSTTMPDGSPWPQVSIVTPSYNQGQYLEETIRSVLFQGYPNLEYIIIDGGSTDGSVEIIHKYEPWLAYWISESDQGQGDALRKGFDQASGEIFAWLNSDDTYLPGCLAKTALAFQEDHTIGVVFGECLYTDAANKGLRRYGTMDISPTNLLHRGNPIAQPASFFLQKTYRSIGGLNSSSNVMDYDLWLRLSLRTKFKRIPDLLATYRLWENSKTVQHMPQLRIEMVRALDSFFDRSDLPESLHIHKAYAYAFNYLHISTAFVEAGDVKKAKEYLRLSLQQDTSSNLDPDWSRLPLVWLSLPNFFRFLEQVVTTSFALPINIRQQWSQACLEHLFANLWNVSLSDRRKLVYWAFRMWPRSVWNRGVWSLFFRQRKYSNSTSQNP